MASTAWAPSAVADSGSTPLTVAFVPTGMNAGVRIWPCGVVITPVRAIPWRAPTWKWKGAGVMGAIQHRVLSRAVG